VVAEKKDTVLNYLECQERCEEPELVQQVASIERKNAQGLQDWSGSPDQDRLKREGGHRSPVREEDSLSPALHQAKFLSVSNQYLLVTS